MVDCRRRKPKCTKNKDSVCKSCVATVFTVAGSDCLRVLLQQRLAAGVFNCAKLKNGRANQTKPCSI